MISLRIGHGFDVHRLVENRKLILCGVWVPYERGLLGHSDADVALHAVMDAWLGALAAGDIGKHFPDTSSEFKDIDSGILLKRVLALPVSQGWRLGNLDVTILAERPKLAGFIGEMRARVAELFDTEIDRISIKATTTEGLGFPGRGEGIAAHAVLIAEKC